MNNDNLRKVRQTLLDEGYTPPEYEQFEKDMQDEKNLLGLHNTLKKEGYTPPEFEQFKKDMGFGVAPEVAPTEPQPTEDKPYAGMTYTAAGLDSLDKGATPNITGQSAIISPEDAAPGSDLWRQRKVAVPGENPYNGRTYGEVYDQVIQDFGKNINHPDIDPYAEARAQIMQAGITDDLKPEQADALALNIREGYANKFAGANAKAMVSQLPDQVPNIDQLMDAMWYNRDLQAKLDKEAQRLGLSHENYVNFFMKPQMAKALSDRYGYDVNSAKSIAARLLSGEQHTMERVRQGEANEMVGRYAEPKIQQYFDRVLNAAGQQLNNEAQNLQITPTGNAGQMMGAALNYYHNTDPIKVWEKMEPEIQQMAKDIVDQEFILEADKQADEEGVTIDQWIESRIEPYLLSQIQSKFEQMALEHEMPKNTMDYLMANIRKSLVGQFGNAILASKARRRMQDEALARTEMGQGQYKPGFGARVAGGVAAMLPDMMYGGPFGLAAKTATAPVQGMSQYLIANGMRPLLARMLQSSAQGALSLGAFEGVKGAAEGLQKDRYDSYLDKDQRSAAEILQDIVKGSFENAIQSGVMGATMIGGPLGQKISNGRGALANALGWGTQVGVDAAAATALNIPKLISGEVTMEDLGNEFAQNLGTFAALGLNHKAKEFASLADGGRAWNGVEFTKKDIETLEGHYLQPLRKFITEVEKTQNRRGLIEQSALGIDASQEQRDAINSAGADMYRDLMHSYAVPRELKVKVAQALGVPVPEYALKPEVGELFNNVINTIGDVGFIDALNYDYNMPGGIADKLRNGESLTNTELTTRLLFQDNEAFNKALAKRQAGEELTEDELRLLNTNMQRYQEVRRKYLEGERDRIASIFELEQGLERGAINRMIRDAYDGKPVDSNILNEFEQTLRKYNDMLSDYSQQKESAMQQPVTEAPATEEAPVVETSAEEAPKVNRVVDEESTGKRNFVLNDEVTIVDEGGSVYKGEIVSVPTVQDGTFAIQTEDGRVIYRNANDLQKSVTEHNGETIAKDNSQQIAPEPVPDTALSRIPKNEKGEADYEKADTTDSFDALVEELGEEAATVIAQSEVDDAKKRLQRIQKQGVKGATIEEKKRSLKERTNAMKEQQAKIDYWTSVLEVPLARKAEAERVQVEKKRNEKLQTPEGRAELISSAKDRQERVAIAKEIYGEYFNENVGEPDTVEELVSMLLPYGKLAWDGYQRGNTRIRGLQEELGSQHTRGLSKDKSTSGFNSYLAKKGEGDSLDEIVHSMYEDDTNLVGNEHRFTTEEIKDAVIDMLLSAEKPTDIRDYTVTSRIARAEKTMRGELEHEAELAEEAKLDENATKDSEPTNTEVPFEAPTEENAPFLKVSADDNSFTGRLTRAKQQTDTEPTEGQKEAGNYKKGHVSFGGYDFVVENPEGSMRRGEANGKKWEQKMNNTYGYILGRYGKDGDHLDMFVNDQADLDNWNGKVYVVDQVNPKTGEFDEHKVMYGFDSEAEARDAYLSNYEKGWKGLGKITGVDKDVFDEWLDSSKRKRVPFAEHNIITSALKSEEKANKKAATAAEIDKALMNELVTETVAAGVPMVKNVAEGQAVLDTYNKLNGEYGDADYMPKAQKVTDQQELDELNNGKTVKRYRAMQLIDGKLYPPMSAKVDGEMRQPTEIGVWEKAEERPDLVKNGKFVLNKGQKGQGNVPAAYNPYFHTSTSGLNDQFTSAYKRPELVVVEVEIPESELTSGYKAEGAKDAVGNVDWHSGVVNGQLPADRQRQVTLSRYSKVNRIVPDSEVADMIAKQLEGTNVEVPYNVVTPAQRAELEKRGVKITDKPAGTVTEDINGNPIKQQKADVVYMFAKNVEMPLKPVEETIPQNPSVWEALNIKDRVEAMSPQELIDNYRRINSQMLEDGLDVDEHSEKVKADYIAKNGVKGLGQVMADDLNYLSNKYGFGKLSLRWDLQDRIKELGLEEYLNNDKPYDPNEKPAVSEKAKAEVVDMHGRPSFFKTPDGHAYGFTYQGKIYIDPRIATAETPIHEYGHLWVEMKRQTSPDEWNHIKDVLLRDEMVKPFIDKVKREYPELEGKDDAFAEEVLTQFSGKHGAEKLRKMAEEIKHELGDDAMAETIAQAAIRKVKSILNEFWKGVADMMGWKYTNAEDVADTILRDMLNGVNPAEKMKETPKDMKQQQEIERTLMGVHNLSEDKLRKVIKAGGLANPSLAVVDTNQGIHTSYGDISLIPKASLIDKRTGRNAGTFAGDAWTPTYPHVERMLTKQGEKRAAEIAKEVAGDDEEMARHIRSRIYDYFEGNGDRMHFLFLKQKGLNPQIRPERIAHSQDEYDAITKIFGEPTSNMPNRESITKEQNDALVDLMVSVYEKKLRDGIDPEKPLTEKMQNYLDASVEEYRKNLLDDDGYIWFAKGDNFIHDNWRDEKRRQNPQPDWYGTDNDASYQVAKEGLAEEYEKWKESLLTDDEVEEKLFAGYTPSGNRLYLPNTVENASRLMNKNADQNAYDQGGFGPTRAMLLQNFASLADIRRHKDLIQKDEKVEERTKELSDELFDIINQISDMQKISDNRFLNIDYAEARLQEAMGKKNPIRHLNKEYGYNIPEDGELASQLMNFMEDVKNLPAKYFETKFKRPVTLDEFEIAVVPEGTSEDVVKALKDAGLDVRTFDNTGGEEVKNENRRKAVMDAVSGRDDILFQKVPEHKPYNLSDVKKDAEGNRMYEREGSIDLWSATPLLAKARRQQAPVRLSERNMNHIISRHSDKLDSEDKVFDFLDNVFANAKILRRAKGRGMFVVVENENTDRAAIIKLMPSEDGDYYNIDTAGFYRKDKWKESEEVIADLSEPGQSDAVTDISKPQTPNENGKEPINAETQASSSDKEKAFRTSLNTPSVDKGEGAVSPDASLSDGKVTDNIREKQEKSKKSLFNRYLDGVEELAKSISEKDNIPLDDAKDEALFQKKHEDSQSADLITKVKSDIDEIAKVHPSLAPSEVFDSRNITDEQLMDVAGQKLSPEELEAGREWLREYKSPALYSPFSKKIYIFADKHGDRTKEGYFHENMHRWLESVENAAEIFDAFWNASTSPVSIENKKSIEEQYANQPEMIPEEYMVNVFGVNMSKGSAGKLLDRLSPEHRQTIEQFLNAIHYDTKAESAARGAEEAQDLAGDTAEAVHGSEQASEGGVSDTPANPMQEDFPKFPKVKQPESGKDAIDSLMDEVERRKGLPKFQKTEDGRDPMARLLDEVEDRKDRVRLQKADLSEEEDIAKKIYEESVAKETLKWQEAWQDSMISLKKLQDAIEAETGNKATGAEDAYAFENRMHGRAKNMSERFDWQYYQPMLKAFDELRNERGWDNGQTMDYLISKHGLERNSYYAFRDALKEKIQEKLDKEKDKLDKEYAKKKIPEEVYKEKIAELQERERTEVDEAMTSFRNTLAYKRAGEDYRNGTIGYSEYLRRIEDLMRGHSMRETPKKDDKGNVVSTNYYDDHVKDYSGLTETLAKEMYDDAQAVKRQAQKMKNAKTKDPQKEKELWAEYDKKMRQAYITARSIAEDAVFAGEKQESPVPLNDTAAGRLWERINEATNETLKISYESGMMDRNTYNKVRDMFEYYVPLRGWDEDRASDIYSYVGKENVFSPAVKKTWGRTSKAENPLAYIGNIATSTILSGHRNLMKQHFLNYVMNNPTSLTSVSESWYENVGTKDAPVWELRTADTAGKSADEIAGIVSDFNQEMSQKKADGMAMPVKGRLRLDVNATKGQKAEHVVEVQRNGHTYQIYINGDPKAAQALNGTAAKAVSRISDTYLGKQLGNLNRSMAAFFTSKNPAFVVSNLSRDLNMAGASVFVNEGAEYNLQFVKNVAKVLTPRMGESSSWVKASEQPTGLMPSLMRKYKNGTLDKNDETERYFSEFMNEGGETGFVNMLSVDSFKEKMQKEIDQLQGADFLGRKGKELSVKKGLRIMGDTFEFYNRCAEDATRFIVYMTSREMGKTMEESIADAKDVTLNFNRKGTGAKGNAETRDLFIFVNPAIQALANMYRMGKGHPLKLGAAAMSFMAGGAMVPVLNQWLLNMFGDDDDKQAYWNLPPWVRKNNLVLWVPGTKNFLTIPLAQEFRVFYGVGEMISSAIMEHPNQNIGTEIVESVADLIPINPTGNGGNLLIDFMPTGSQPLMQLGFNTDFTGKPIWKDNQGNKYDPASSKAYASTPEWMVDVSRKLNEWTGGDEDSRGWLEKNTAGSYINNPAVWNHLLQGYLGGMYNTIAKAFDTAYSGGKYLFADGEAPNVYQVPVVNRFLNRPSERDNAGVLGEDYWQLISDNEEFLHNLRAKKKKADAGDKEAATKLQKLMDSEDYRRSMVINQYKEMIDAQRKAEKEETDKEMLEAIKQSISAYKEELMEEINAVDGGQDPQEIVMKKFDESTDMKRKNAMAKRIAKHAGASKDTYGGQAEKDYQYQYQLQRTAQDVYDDAILYAYQEQLRDKGDEKGKDLLSKERERIHGIIKGLRGEETDKAYMDRLRENRQKLLNKYGLLSKEEKEQEETQK